MRGPFLPTAFARARPRRVGSVGSAPSAWHVAGYMSGASSGCGAAAGLLRCSQRGTSGTRCDYGVLKGHPSLWVQCTGTCRGTWLLLVRRSTAERPSPLWVCSDLGDNKLTGSVPSWLSALTNLAYLCVPPSCQRRLHVWLTWVGSVGSAPSSAACLRHRAGAVRQQGCCDTLKRGPPARDVTKEYSRGTPPYGYSARVPSGHMVAVGAA